jgi:uncharacterized protein with GYD domain
VSKADEPFRLGDRSTVAYLFLKCNLATEPIDNFEKVLAVLESLESGKTEHIASKELREDVSRLLVESSGINTRASFLTYGIFDILMVVESKDPSNLSKFIANLRQTIAGEIYETAAIIGVPNRPSRGKSFEVDISMSLLPGREGSVIAQMQKVFQRKGFSECKLGWQYGYYDIACSIKVNDLHLLYLTISKEIRKIEGVIATATSLGAEAGGWMSSLTPKPVKLRSFPIRTGSDFVEDRRTIWDMIKKTKESNDISVRMFSERQNSLFSQLEQILYRLRYLRFR